MPESCAMPRSRRCAPETAGIRGALTGMAAKAADTRSHESLDTAATVAANRTARAAAMRARIDATRRQHDQAAHLLLTAIPAG